MRRMFADSLAEPQYSSEKITPEVFHYTMALAKSRGWLDSSQYNPKWFETDYNKRETPTPAVMTNTLLEVSRALRETLED